MREGESTSDRYEPRPADVLDPQGFAAHFAEAFRTLWLVAVGVVRDRALAEDVVQEAAIVALGKLEQFEPGTNFRAWMSRITRNIALNAARKRVRRPEAALDPSAIEYAATDRSAGAPGHGGLGERLAPDAYAFDDAVLGALRLVGDTARACLLLRTIEGLAYGEISELLDIPEGTAMSHVHRARKAMREYLVQRDPTLGAAGWGAGA